MYRYKRYAIHDVFLYLLYYSGNAVFPFYLLQHSQISPVHRRAGAIETRGVGFAPQRAAALNLCTSILFGLEILKLTGALLNKYCILEYCAYK